MDWRMMGGVFVTVFLAELGDKTQLTALAAASGSRSRFGVFVAASLALVCSTALAVAAADAIARFVSPKVLQRASSVLFLLLGAYGLWSTRKS